MKSRDILGVGRQDICYSRLEEMMPYYYKKLVEVVLVVLLFVYVYKYIGYCIEWYRQYRRLTAPGQRAAARKQGDSRRIASEKELPPIISYILIGPAMPKKSCNLLKLKTYLPKITTYTDYTLAVLRVFSEYNLSKTMVQMRYEIEQVYNGLQYCTMVAIVLMDIDYCPFKTIVYTRNDNGTLLPYMGCCLTSPLKAAYQTPQETSSKPRVHKSFRSVRVCQAFAKHLDTSAGKRVDSISSRKVQSSEYKDFIRPRFHKSLRSVDKSAGKRVDSGSSSRQVHSSEYKDYIRPVLYCGGAAILLYGAYRYFRH